MWPETSSLPGEWTKTFFFMKEKEWKMHFVFSGGGCLLGIRTLNPGSWKNRKNSQCRTDANHCAQGTWWVSCFWRCSGPRINEKIIQIAGSCQVKGVCLSGPAVGTVHSWKEASGLWTERLRPRRAGYPHTACTLRRIGKMSNFFFVLNIKLSNHSLGESLTENLFAFRFQKCAYVRTVSKWLQWTSQRE